MSSRKVLSKAEQKTVLAALLLADDERRPLSLNPSERGTGARRLTAAEHRRLIGQGLRHRRNDVLYTLLTMAKSPMGESR